MGQSSLIGMMTTGENKWRSDTEPQRQRNNLLMILKRPEKIAFLKWAKEFDAEPLGYIRFCQGQYSLPENDIVKVMAIGYLCDISEVKRLHNEEDITVNWTPIPFGFTKEQWDDPETVIDTLMDRADAEDNNSDSDSDSKPVELGTNSNILEEVIDQSDLEPESDNEVDSDTEIKSLVCEVSKMTINEN